MRRLVRYLMYGGVIVVVLGLSKVHARYVAPTPYVWHTSSRVSWSCADIAFQCLVAYGLGLPDVARTRRSAVVTAVMAALGGAVVLSVVQLAVGDALLPRFVVASSVLLLVPWYSLCWWLATGGRSRAESRDRVLLVGGVSDAEQLAADLQGEAERPAALVRHLSVAAAESDAGQRPLIDAVRDARATVVVLDNEARGHESIVAQAASLHESGLRIRTLSLFYEQWLGKLPLSELERVGLMFDIGEVHRTTYARVRRMIDVPLSMVGAIVLVLVTPFVLLGNVFANRGPLIYRQERIGKDGRPFNILKFRTMRRDERGGTTDWTSGDDPRITPFGRLLRTSHLDELPQVVNILRGDLAVVGPRPEQPHYVEQLREKLPFYELRHLVHPGLTGWAQVKYGYAGDERDALEKLQYEFFYLRHQGIAFDLRIIGRTVRSVLGRGGR